MTYLSWAAALVFWGYAGLRWMPAELHSLLTFQAPLAALDMTIRRLGGM